MDVTVMSENKKAGFCVLAGRPNVGKSTLMNRLIGTKIAITSPKPQTTRNSIRTVYTDDRGQAVFIDTPGIHKSKNRLSDYMMAAVGSSIKDADLILYMENGNIVEQGNHNSLMEQGGKYADLYNSQFAPA